MADTTGISRTDILVRQAEAMLAFGGGKMTPETEQLFRDRVDGQITDDEFKAALDARYKKA